MRYPIISFSGGSCNRAGEDQLKIKMSNGELEAVVDVRERISTDSIQVCVSGSWVPDRAEIKSQDTEPQQILERGWVTMSSVWFRLSPSVLLGTV